MGQLIRAPKIKVVTEDGKCDIHITLDLNINVSGMVESNEKLVKKVEKDEEDDTLWEIPSFKPAEKISFGKKKEI